MPKKIYVLDTNVILHEPLAPLRFGAGAEVVLPIYVIEELDRFKRDASGLGRNAREFSRMLDGLRGEGQLIDGVSLKNGGCFRVALLEERNGRSGTLFAESNIYDNLILQCGLREQKLHPEAEVIFVSQDTNLRIRADVVGLKAVDYEPDRVEISDLYPGHRELEVNSEQIQEAFSGGLKLEVEGLFPNEFLLLRDISRSNHTALGRFDAESEQIKALPRRRESIWGIQPRNMEQSYALQLLMDDEIQLVTLVGKAGTGKTLLALAAGLHKVTDEDRYQRVLVSRPIFPLGRDLGFLPGTVEEKLGPWMNPIKDNIELLLNLRPNPRRDGRGYEDLCEMGLLEVEPLTYIRGRSIPKQYLIVDEAQNLTPHEVKTILTRVGEETKIVFTGDPYQIDNPYVDANSNGLVHLVNRFREQHLAGTVTLSKGERSPLAELAANLL